MFSNNKISVRQLQMMLTLYAFGSGVVILPRKAAGFALRDAWLVIIISTAIALLYGFTVTMLVRSFPGRAFFPLAASILGKPVAWILCFGLGLRLIASIAMELRFFGEIIKQTLLPNTPYFFIVSTISLAAAYAAFYSCETGARIAGALLPIVLAPLVIVFGTGAIGMDISVILPILETDASNLFSGGFYCVIAFTCLELIPLANPFISDHKRLGRGIPSAVIFIGLCLFVITLVTISELGPDETSRRTWPVIDMMDAIKFPFSIIERQGALIMSFWIASVFFVIGTALFFASLLFKDMLKASRQHVCIIVCLIIAVFLSFLPRDIAQAEMVLDYLFTIFGIAYLFIVPLLLLIFAKIRGIDRS